MIISTAPTLAFDTLGSEETFVHLDHVEERALGFANTMDALA